jgi:hypothetical protein
VSQRAAPSICWHSYASQAVPRPASPISTNDLALFPADPCPTRLQQRQLLLPALQGCMLP